VPLAHVNHMPFRFGMSSSSGNKPSATAGTAGIAAAAADAFAVLSQGSASAGRGGTFPVSSCSTRHYNPLAVNHALSAEDAASYAGADLSAEHSLQDLAGKSCRAQLLCGNLLFEAFTAVPLGEQQEPPGGQQRLSSGQMPHAGEEDDSSAAAATAAALAAAAAVQDALGMHTEGRQIH
jgi:hypothetical protein